MNIFGEWRFCGYLFRIIAKLDYFWRSFLCIMYFRVFLKVKVQIMNIFGGMLKFKILFWVRLIFLIICWGKQ